LSLLRGTSALPHVNLLALAERRPQAIADFVLQSSGAERVTVSLSDVAYRLRTEQLLAIFERRPDTLNRYSSWFTRLAPEQRATVYAAFPRRLRTPGTSGTLPVFVVASLAREQREREARRHVDLERLDATVRLSYTTYLPWEEAHTEIEPALHS